jgi:hypothetical protein
MAWATVCLDLYRYGRRRTGRPGGAGGAPDLKQAVMIHFVEFID